MAQNEFDMAARDILQRIKQTEPKSAERLNLLVQANDQRLLNASRTGANVSITLKPSDIQSPLDDIKVAVFHRKHPQGHPNAGQDDGIGVFGGRSDPVETPIYTVLREMVEEMLDARMISCPKGIESAEFVKAKLTAFVSAYPDAYLASDSYNSQSVKQSLAVLQEQGAVFEIDEDHSIDLKRLSFAPMDEAIDLSFPMSIDKGSDMFDGLQVTKPYQFIYITADEAEFNSYLTGENHETEELGEARGVKAMSLREILKANKSGLPDYNPETDVRYTHEGFTAAIIALQHGADHSEVYAEHPAPAEMAKLMGISDATFKEWHRRAIRNINPDLGTPEPQS